MPPASAAKTNSVQSGAWQRVQISSSKRAIALVPVAYGSTRRWPKRSAARAICGASSAMEKANVAATAPANQ